MATRDDNGMERVLAEVEVVERIRASGKVPILRIGLTILDENEQPISSELAEIVHLPHTGVPQVVEAAGPVVRGLLLENGMRNPLTLALRGWWRTKIMEGLESGTSDKIDTNTNA